MLTLPDDVREHPPASHLHPSFVVFEEIEEIYEFTRLDRARMKTLRR